MKTKRVLSIVLSLSMGMGLFYFSGCSKDNKKEIVIWHSSGSQQDEALNDIVNRYNETQDEYKVVAKSQPSANFLDNVYNAVANGVGPDIIFNYASTVSDYLAAGKVVDLGQYFDLEELRTLVPSAVYDECTSFGDEKLYCLPLHSSGPVFFYDKDLYTELNLAIPTTWAQLENNSKIIYETKGIAGFAADSLTDLMQCLILQNGTGYIDVENKKVLFNTSETASSLDWYGKNVRAGYFTNEKDGSYFYNNFNAGLVGSIIASCGCEEYITLTNYGVAPLPQMGNVKWTPTWNRALILFKSTSQKEAAAANFLKFFTNAENSAQWSIASGNISPYSYTAEIEAYQAFLLSNKALAVVDSSKAFSTMLPTLLGSSTVRNELERLAILSISSDTSIQEALNAAETRCNEALAK